MSARLALFHTLLRKKSLNVPLQIEADRLVEQQQHEQLEYSRCHTAFGEEHLAADSMTVGDAAAPVVRQAEARDCTAIAEYNIAMAKETEDLDLDRCSQFDGVTATPCSVRLVLHTQHHGLNEWPGAAGRRSSRGWRQS